MSARFPFGRAALGPMAALLFLLTGCCSGVATDPRAGGLAGGVCGEATGAYRLRVAEREAVLQGFDRANAALSDDLGTTNREARSIGDRIAAQRKRIASDRTALAALDADIAAAEASGRIGSARKAELLGELDTLDSDYAELLRRSGERERTARALRQGVADAREARDLDIEIGSDDRRRENRREALDALRRKLSAERNL